MGTQQPRGRSREAAEQAVREIAALFGWRHHHHDGLRDPDGFPGATMVRGERLLFVTVASRRGELIPPEAAWVVALRAVRRVDLRVVTPDEITELVGVLALERAAASPGEERA